MNRLQAAAGLRLFFWAVIGELVLTGLSLLFFQLILESVSGAPEQALQVFSGTRHVLGFGLVSVMVFGTARVATALEGTARAWVLLAAGLMSLRGLISLGYLGLSLTDVELGTPTAVAISWLIKLVWVAQGAGVLGALVVVAHAFGARPPIAAVVTSGICLLSGTGFDIYSILTLDLPWEERPGVWLYHVQSALDIAGSGFLALAAGLMRTRLLSSDKATLAGNLNRVADPAWSAAATGLSTYGVAVKARLVLAVIAVPLLMLVGRSRDMDAVVGVMTLVALPAIALTVTMMVGLFQYLRVPEASGARETGWVAVALIIMSFGFDIWALILVLNLSGGGLSAAFDLQDQAPWAEAGGQALAITALILLMSSFNRAASALGDLDLGQRASQVAWLLGGAGIVGVLVRLIATTARGAEPLLILAIPVLIAAIIGLVRFFRVLGELTVLMRAGPPQDDEGPVRSFFSHT